MVICNAKELYTFAEANMKSPAPSRYQSENVELKHRVFFYAAKVNRERAHQHFKVNLSLFCTTQFCKGVNILAFKLTAKMFCTSIYAELFILRRKKKGCS